MQGSMHKGGSTGCLTTIGGGCYGAVLPAAETGAAVPFLKMLTSAVLLQILSELVESARSHNFTDLVMVHEHRGEPDGLVVCHLPYGPTAYFGIFNTVGLRISRRALPVRWAHTRLEISAGLAQPMLGGRLSTCHSGLRTCAWRFSMCGLGLIYVHQPCCSYSAALCILCLTVCKAALHSGCKMNSHSQAYCDWLTSAEHASFATLADTCRVGTAGPG